MAVALQANLEDQVVPDPLTYRKDGEERAYALGNRGRIKFQSNGKLDTKILDSYYENGFYVFENVLSNKELAELRGELADLLDHAPTSPDSTVDRYGNPAVGAQFKRPPFQFAKPLSDPYGGTAVNGGRHPAKMHEPTPKADAPEYTIFFIYGMCELMDSFLRLYGHPDLLQVAETVNGSDFTPFTDTIWIKEPELGTSIAWHQDGTTHWDHPQWEENIHGFNFMTQLEDTNAENALWVVPGSHKEGKADIKQMVEDNGCDRLPNAVPMLCKAGDVAICNRQVVHGSFANTSTQRRVSVVFGFHKRSSIIDVETTFGRGERVVYDEERVHQRSRVIQVAIDARQQHFADEQPYSYQPLQDHVEENRLCDQTRQEVLRDYASYHLGI